MQITTELDPGEKGFFLTGNELIEREVMSVRITAVKGAGSVCWVEYEIYAPHSGNILVPEIRAGKTKADLLKKL